MSAELISIKVKQVSGGADIALPPLADSTTVGNVKAQLEGHVSAPTVAIRLIHKGKILKDEDSLAASGIKNGETIIVQINKKALLGGGASPVGAPVAAAVPSPVPARAVAPAAVAAPAVVPVPAASASLDDMYDEPVASGPPEMVAAMDALVRGNSATESRTGLETLVKIIDNVIKNPTEEKYRKIKKDNAVFNRKVGGIPGGKACVLACGFVDDGSGSFVLAATAEAWVHLNACVKAIAARLATMAPPAPPPAPAPAPAPAVAAPLGFGGFGDMGGGFGGMGGMGGMDHGAMMEAIASNPAMVEQMLNNPMLQSMAAGNPMMAQQLAALRANPGLLSMALQNPAMRQMLSDPQAMQQAQRMMQGMTPAMQQQMMQMGGMGAMGGMAPPASVPARPPASHTTPPRAPAPGSGSGDESKTEDELIAEAIARSLQDK